MLPCIVTSAQFLYAALTLLAVVVFSSVLVMALRNRDSPGAVQLSALIVALLGISLCQCGLLNSAHLAAQRFWFTVTWLIVPWIGLIGLAVVLHTLGWGTAISRRWLLLLGSIPLGIGVVMVVRPELFARPHFFMEEGFTLWRVTPGPVYIVTIVYVCGLLLAVMGLLLWKGVTGARRDVLIRACLFCSLVPCLVANTVAIGTANRMFPGFPQLVARFLQQCSFVVLALGFAAAVFRFGWLKLPPLAAKIFNTFQDPICVCDPNHHLLFANNAFCALVGKRRGAFLGQNLREALPLPVATMLCPPDSALEHSPAGWDAELTDAGGRMRAFLVSQTQYREWGGIAAIVTVMRDITLRKQVEAERDAQLKALNEALSEVRQLRDFLPICSYCKKVRDDENYWQQIDEYITRHTGVLFSHGLCPQCLDEQVRLIGK